MSTTKVLVVDDSLTMRALISGALERLPNVTVVGAADGAAEARTMRASLKPDVMTLDVEMPVTSGIEYLAEIMGSDAPMPVIMFSTRTEAGASSSVEALRLGAVDCFPKPKVAAQAEFDAVLGKLGKRIQAAKGMVLKKPQASATVAMPGEWNGRMIAIGADAANTQQLFTLFASLPENCPPILVVQHVGPGLVEGMVAKLDEKILPEVVVATDGMPIKPGTIYFAPQGTKHMVVDKWPGGNCRLLERDPVAGERPSISLLYASLAKVAGADTIAALLTAGADGPSGLKPLLAAGGRSLVPADDEVVLTRGDHQQRFPAAKLTAAMLKLAAK